MVAKNGEEEDPKPKKKNGEEEEEDEDDWTPDKPLDDADDEDEAERRAKGHARYEYLKEQHKKRLEEASDPKNKGKKKKPAKPGEKKSSLW